jgi:hypothetical protein
MRSSKGHVAPLQVRDQCFANLHVIRAGIVVELLMPLLLHACGTASRSHTLPARRGHHGAVTMSGIEYAKCRRFPGKNAVVSVDSAGRQQQQQQREGGAHHHAPLAVVSALNAQNLIPDALPLVAVSPPAHCSYYHHRHFPRPRTAYTRTLAASKHKE